MLYANERRIRHMCGPFLIMALATTTYTVYFYRMWNDHNPNYTESCCYPDALVSSPDCFG